MPRHETRAVRSTGPETRRQILEAARILFTEWGLNGVSLTDIASEADVFPSQVTYYFGSKDALFVEAASRELLLLASKVEEAGSRSATPEQWARSTVKTALEEPGLLVFVEAMLLARSRPDLAPTVARTLEHLHAEGERALAAKAETNGWQLRAAPALEARAFWSGVLGVALEKAVTGHLPSRESAEAVVLLMFNFHRTKPDRDEQEETA
jgi:AcrR family transcriptional regulator